MIDTKFKTEGDALIMDMKGHASFAEMGKDPVCAGASILAMTVAQCIRNMGDERKFQKRPTIRIQNGRVLVVCKPKPAYYAEALHIYYMGETGMHLLAESYPDNVSLTPFAMPEKG